MVRFKDTEIVKFLELYKLHECLWKCSHRHYREKSKRNWAYAHIRDEMHLGSILEVKQKIKSFRDTYASERSKMKRSLITAMHDGDVYRTKLRWYNLADSFLNYTDVRDEIEMMPEDTRDGSVNISMQEPAEYNAGAIHLQTSQVDSPMIMNSNHIENMANDRQFPRRSGPKSRDLFQADEFYHFGMNVAMQLKSIPLLRALHLQTKIQQILYEERVACEQSYYSKYDNEGCASSSVSLVEDTQLSFQEGIPFLASPKEEVVKTEYSIDEVPESMSSGAF